MNFWKFNETLTNDVVSFEQPGPDVYWSVNYIWSLAKFTWTPSGFIHFAHDPI